MSDERRAWRTDEEWSRLRERIDGAELPIARGPRWSVWGAAAAVVLTIGLGWRTVRLREPEPRIAMTAAGERIVIHLADSSVVTLGPASRIRYIVGPRRREVDLEGLADFKVVHDSGRPFIVRARNAVTTDLGTRFVMRAYAADASVQVSVTEGAISLSSGRESKPIALRPGDVGHVAAHGAPVLESRGRARDHAAWVDGRLLFDDEPLANVAAELGRWFDADVRVAGESLAKRRVSAVYNNPSLAGVLEALEATLGVRPERSNGGRTIVISSGAK